MSQRPPHVKAPAYLSKSPPVPAPDPLPGEQAKSAREPVSPVTADRNPTRYGDWELNGLAIDF